MALVPFKKQDDTPAPGRYDGGDPSAEEDALDDGRMSFLDHLDELRRRLTHGVVALLAGFVVAMAFAQQAQDFVMTPLLATLPEGGHFIDNMNPKALEVVRGAYVEPSMTGAAPGTRVQFERLAYFCVDPDSSPSLMVVNRTISLRDSWAKQEGKPEGKA